MIAAATTSTMSVVKAGVAAALAGIGMHGAVPSMHALQNMPIPYVHKVPRTEPVPATRKALLTQIDHRLGLLVQIQTMELAAAERGGIFDTSNIQPLDPGAHHQK